ncbi:MAG: biopolymer transporter ExbD [Candidatus Omnitrophica bacterium]|nr:biopolymer transporter ExbD [Candidatus Omnitrophota bacterium]
MRFKTKRIEFEKGQLDLAPLIDVLFLLLIFFMLTSSFVYQPGIKIDLPKAVTSEVIKEKNIVIMLTGENTVYLNNKIVTMKELLETLKSSSYAQRPVLIKADKKASLGRVVQIWDACRDAGITQINLATNQDIAL